MTPTERAALSAAVERGWLSPTGALEVERALSQGTPLVTLLTQRLRPEQVQALARAAAARPSTPAPAVGATHAAPVSPANAGRPGNATQTASDAPPPSAAIRPLGETPTRLGAYRIEGELARGGMGVVLAGVHEALGRQVAIKLVGGLADARSLERFRREAVATARLRHPNIVALHDYSTDQGLPYLVMDRIDGGTLAARLAGGPLADEEAARIAERLADALACAHAQGVLHRDLKPSNVLLDEAGEPLLTDFGLAQLREGESDMTRTGVALGTPAYMPPEQARGDRAAVGERSDVYGLGAIIYEMLTGAAPFAQSDAVNLIVAAMFEEVTPPSERRPGVDPALEAICLRCLRKRPDERWASARELSDALGAWRRGARVAPVARPARGLRAAALVASAIATGLLTALVPVGRGADVAPEAVVIAPDPLLDAPPDAPAPTPASAVAWGWALSAEEAHWQALRADPAAEGPLIALVRGRLEREALMDLEHGWEEVARRLAPTDARDLPSEGAERVAERLGAERPLAVRVHAALAGAACPQACVVEALEVAAASSTPLLRQAARSSLLALGRLPSAGAVLEPGPAAGFAAWAAAAAEADEGADGAGAALTLLERAPLLAARDVPALEALACARAPWARAALALALARASQRAGGLEASAVEPLLAALAADRDPLVRRVASGCAKALRLEGDALELAFRLASEPGARPEARRALTQALAEAKSTPEVEWMRARTCFAWGDPAAAGPALQVALAGAPTSLEAQELTRQLALLRDEKVADTAFAGVHDPLALRLVAARLDFVRRHGLPALPGPDGALRVPVDLPRRQVAPRGLVVWRDGLDALVRTAFAFDGWQAVEVETGCASASVTLDLPAGDLERRGLVEVELGRGKDVSLSSALRAEAGWTRPTGGAVVSGLTVLRGRGVVTLDVDGRPLGARSLAASPWLAAGHARVELRGAGALRLLLCGRWEPLAGRPLLVEPEGWARTLEPVAGTTRTGSFAGTSAVQEVAALRDWGGQLLVSSGPWPDAEKKVDGAQAVWVAARGDLDLRARLSHVATAGIQAGIGLRWPSGEVLLFGPGGGGLALYLLRPGAEAPVLVAVEAEPPGEDRLLRLRRVGEHVLLEHGPTREGMARFGAPLYLPLGADVDVLLFARRLDGSSSVPAHFREVELLTARTAPGSGR